MQNAPIDSRGLVFENKPKLQSGLKARARPFGRPLLNCVSAVSGAPLPAAVDTGKVKVSAAADFVK